MAKQKKNYPGVSALLPDHPDSIPSASPAFPFGQPPRDRQSFRQSYAKTHVGGDYDRQTGQLGHYQLQSQAARLQGEPPQFQPMEAGMEQWLREKELGEPSLTRPVMPSFPLDKGPSNGPAVRAHRLGDLSMQYETGYGPGHEDQAAARVSTGKDDAGGRSYGAYQLSSAKGQVQKFQREEGAAWSPELAGKDPAAPGAYDDAWKSIPARDPAFFDAQHKYIDRTHYTPAVDHVRQRTGLDLNARSAAVRDAVWSTAVQHGKAPQILEGVVRNLGTPPYSPNYDPDFINALYDARSRYVDGVKDMKPRERANVKARYAKERRDALDELAR